ncbi:hypothetical protein TNCV_319431 [Trichonephila clavipes]|nr:hypothetical protein TNCV_319431 [Trichonephila clavipes]
MEEDRNTKKVFNVQLAAPGEKRQTKPTTIDGQKDLPVEKIKMRTLIIKEWSGKGLEALPRPTLGCIGATEKWKKETKSPVSVTLTGLCYF